MLQDVEERAQLGLVIRNHTVVLVCRARHDKPPGVGGEEPLIIA